MTSVDPRLNEHREVWERKPGVRAIYADYHRRLLDPLPSGEPLLEIGGGSGNLWETSPDIVSVDLLASPWVDVACDAHQLPFNAGAFGGIAMLDVLHHLARLAAFFDEAARVFLPGGRLVMIEPGITPFSWPFYQFLHQEPVDMSVDPAADQPPEVAEDPFLEPGDTDVAVSAQKASAAVRGAASRIPGERRSNLQSLRISIEWRL